MDLVWPDWTAPAVSAVTLDGVQLVLAVTDGGVDWGDLAPLLAGGGTGGARALPRIAVTDALVDITHPDGPTAVSVTGMDLAPQKDGALVLTQAAFDVVHPKGQASLRATGRRTQGGALRLDLAIEDARASAGPVALANAVGSLRLAGDPARPGEMSGEGTFEVSGLALPGGLRTAGKLTLRLRDGQAAVTADLTDDGLGLTLVAKAEGAPFDRATVAKINLQAAAADLGRLPLTEGVTGGGTLDLTAEGALGDLLSGDPMRLPPVQAEITLTGVEYPGVPGAWTARAKAGVRPGKGTATLTFAEPVEVSGGAWGGEVTASVPGTVHVQPDPFKVTSIELAPARIALTKADVGGVTITGPLALVLTPRKGGLTLAPDGGAFALTKADFTFAADSPSLTVRAGSQSAVLRTAKAEGGVTVTLPAEGPPGVHLDLAGMDAHAPELDVEAQGLGLTAMTRGGPDASWNVQANAKALRHAAAAPFAASAKGHWNKRKWDVEGTLRQHRTGLIAGFAAGQDLRSGTGRARLDTVPLNLAGIDGGIHALTPLLAPFVKSMTGTVQVSAKATWDNSGLQPLDVTASLRGSGITPASTVLPAGLKVALAGVGSLAVEATLPPGNPAAGRGIVTVTGGNLRLGPAQAAGISGMIELDRLWPPRTPPGQQLRIERVTAALPAGDGQVRFQVKGLASVNVERAELTGIGGRIWAENVAVVDGTLPERVILNVANLGLADLAAQMNILGLTAEGRLSGRIPIELGRDGAVTIRDGLLEAQGKGLLAFQPPTRAPAGQGGGEGRMDLVLDILENLRFEDLSLALDGDATKDMRVILRVNGRNPRIQQGRPVDLTVNLTGNIGDAIRAELQNFDIKGLTGAGPAGN